MKKTKILLFSILTVMLCVSLISGATFALFTSESSVNIAVTSGKVDVKAEIDNSKLLGYYYNSADATERAETKNGEDGRVQIGDTTAVIAESTVTIANFIPGYGFEFGINITNYSSVAAKYSVELAPDNKETDSVELFKALEVKVESVDADSVRTELSLSGSPSGGLYSNWEDVAPVSGDELTTGKIEKQIIVTVEFPYEVDDNSLQGKTCNIVFAVKAIQDNANADNPETGKISVFSALDLKALASQIEENNGYEGETIVLMRDIDFAEPEMAAFAMIAAEEDGSASEFTPIGTEATPFKGTFDGQFHTIKNFAVEGKNVALFGATEGAIIQNLVIENASVKVTEDNGVAGVLVAEAKNSLTVSNVVVKGSTVEADASASGATVGGLIGSVTATDESESTVNVDCSTFEGTGASDLVGKSDENANVAITDSAMTDTETGETAEWDESGLRVTVDENGERYILIGSEKELTDFITELSATGGDKKIAFSADVKINEFPEDKSIIESRERKEAYTLGKTKDTCVNLTINLNGHDVLFESYMYSKDYFSVGVFTVKSGSSLTITDTAKEKGTLSIVTCSAVPISVSGAGSTVTFENVNVDCKATYCYYNSNNRKQTGYNPIIKATDGAIVNLLDGAHFTAIDDGSTLDPSYAKYSSYGSGTVDLSMDTTNKTVMLYRVGYIVAVGNGSKTATSVLNIDGATVEVGGMVTPFVVGGRYSELNFKSGEITSSSGNGSAVFLLSTDGFNAPSSAKDRSAIRMTGGTINMTGGGAEPEEVTSKYGDYMIAITDNRLSYGYVYVSGGVINLNPTSGIAVGVAAYQGGNDGNKIYKVGGNVTINVNATNGARAAAIASNTTPEFHIYQGLTINVTEGDIDHNIDFFWVGKEEIKWEVSQPTNHSFKGSKPIVGGHENPYQAPGGVFDNRSEDMPEN